MKSGFYDLTDFTSAQERLAAHERMILPLSRNDEEARRSFQAHGFEEVIDRNRAIHHTYSTWCNEWQGLRQLF
jgi:hypothetical protein